MTYHPIRLTVALLVALGASLGAQTPTDDEIRHPVIDSLARSLVGSAVPGLAVLAIRDGEVIHRAGYGVRSAATDSPVTLHTPFYIASVAKMFTAAAVLRLVDEGHLSLDERLSDRLAVVPDYAREITVRQVLTHSSGLVDHYDIGGEERGYSDQDVLDILHDQDSLLFTPGTRAAYSNSGYVLLARLVERVSGDPFATYIRTRFFEPLEMIDSFVAVDGAGPTGRAVGHRGDNGRFEVWDYSSSTLGAGGVYASLADLERWYRGLADGRVVSSESLALASRPPELEGGALTPYGMGWLAEFHARGPLSDRWYVFAFGSLRGFRAVFQWYQEEDALLVWLGNGDSGRTLDAMRHVNPLVILGSIPKDAR